MIEKVTLFSFLILLLCTAFCNRLSIDDLFFKYRIDTVGLGGIIDDQYSRVAAYFLNGCIIALDSRISYMLYNLVSIFVFAYFLVRVVVLLLPEDYADKKRFAILFFLFFFFCCIAPSEVFFWYTQVSTYLWCMNCILIVLFFLLKGFSSDGQWILFLIACAFIGSSSEFLAAQFLLLLLVAVAGRKIVLFRLKHAAVFVSGMTLLLLSLAITAFSPGIALRNELLETRYLGDAFLFSFILSGKYLLSLFAWPRSGYILLFIIAFFILGSRTRHNFRLSIAEVVLYALFVIVSLTFTAYKLSDIAPPRALIICDLIGLFLLARLAMQTGQYFGHRIPVPEFVYGLGVVLFGLACFFHCTEAFRYARAYDAREKIIRQTASDPIVVNVLPKPYFISSCNIGSDSLDFRNQHLKLAHGINANIITAAEKDP